MSLMGFDVFVTVSTGHFDPLIEACNRLSSKFRFFAQIGSSSVIPNFPYVRTMSMHDLQLRIEKSDVVVTHAGTGMLTHCYRARKVAVVVPKQKRYGETNDGQVELAQKWSAIGLGVLCLNLQNLESAILEARVRTFKAPTYSPLGTYLRNLLVFHKVIV